MFGWKNAVTPTVWSQAQLRLLCISRYESRFVDVREPTLIEHRHGYVFIRRGLYRASFNWWQLQEGPGDHFSRIARWKTRRAAFLHLPEVISLRTAWEANFWHCHDEVLSKFIMMEDRKLPATIPCLVSPQLWSRRFFQEMIQTQRLCDRRWIVHDQPVTADRVILCVQGPMRFENALFARDLFTHEHHEVPRRSLEREPASKSDQLIFIIRPPFLERHFDQSERNAGRPDTDRVRPGRT